MKRLLSLCLVLLFSFSYTAQAQSPCEVIIYDYSDPATGTTTLSAEIIPSSSDTIAFGGEFFWNDDIGNVYEGQTITVSSSATLACVEFWIPGTDCGGYACIDLPGDGGGSGGGGDDCWAEFGYEGPIDGTYYFYGFGGSSAVDTMTAVSYEWLLGNGDVFTGQNITYAFDEPGTYEVCLTITTADGCSDTYCQAITVSGGGGSGSGDCDATFFAALSPIGGITCTPLTVSDDLMYLYTVAETGESYFGPYPTFAPTDVATVTICLEVYTMTEELCDSYCETITIGGGGGDDCWAEFGYEMDGDEYYFYGFGGSSSVDTMSAISYEWFIGNGDVVTGQNFVYGFDESGVYEVCLTITTADGCSATYCQEIVVTVGGGGGTDGFSICGFVTTGDGFGTDMDLISDIHLFSFSADGTYTFVATQTTMAADSNYYCFNDLPAGVYAVQAAVNPESTLYPYYMPTYYGDDLFWIDADLITLESDFYGANIDLIDVAGFPGHGTGGGQIDIYRSDNISGHVFNLEGEPMDGILVMLLNMSDVPLGYQYTSTDGSYAFTDVPFGDYQVYVEHIGMTTEAADITLDEDTPSIPNIDFLMGDGNVVLSAIEELIIIDDQIQLYPNPVQQEAFISLSSLESTDLQIEILDVQGRVHYSQSQAIYAGEQVIQLPTADLSKGLYIAHLLSTSGQQIAIPFVK